MVKSGLLAITFGANPVSMKEKTVKELIKNLKENSYAVKGSDDIRAVASISAGNNEYIGNLIVEAIDKIGPDGVISIESSSTSETTVIVEEGMKAMIAPAKLIASNAGVDGDMVVEKIKACDSSRVGYNAMNGRYEDLMTSGVIDPCRVSRCALQNAVSVAGMILTTQTILVEKAKQSKPPVPPIPGISP